jgi:hypothetical protein
VCAIRDGRLTITNVRSLTIAKDSVLPPPSCPQPRPAWWLEGVWDTDDEDVREAHVAAGEGDQLL